MASTPPIDTVGHRLAQLTPTRVSAKRIVVIAVLVVVGAGMFGGGVESRLSPAAGFRDPGAESTTADRFLDEHFRAGAPNVLVVVRSTAGADVDAIRGPAIDVAERLRTVPGVGDVSSYWETGAAAMRSDDATSGLITARLVGDEDTVDATFVAAEAALEGADDELMLHVGGEAAVNHATLEQSERDLARAEVVAAPAVLAVLLVVFRGVVAALVPLVVGVAAVVMTFAVLMVATGFGDVSIFALNLTTALGFGLAVDYSLLFLTRYRAEVAAGNDAAMATTLSTAGRSIMFSAGTTAAALACMAVFPLGFLRSLAIAGPAVVLLSAALALVVVPAVVTLLGSNLERWTLPGRSTTTAASRWRGLAERIGHRPLVVAGAAVVGLLVLALPLAGLRSGLSDDRIHAPGADVRTAHDLIRDSFDSREFGAAGVAFPGGTSTPPAEVAAALSRVPDVGRVDSVAGSFAAGELVVAPDAVAAARFEREGATWFNVVPTVEPLSTAGRDLVHAIRSLPESTEAIVGGIGARQVDATAAVADRALPAIALVAALSFGLIATLSRSILIPAKAVALNGLSVAATLGVVVWVFQHGNLSGPLGFTPSGSIDLSILVLIVSVAFGLAMDYEVFLTSRMREEYERAGDNTTAVVSAVDHTAKVITASAVLVALVFGSFFIADIAVVKMAGIGIALAVIIDAFIVRSTLTPALMFLAGRANWWWPARRARRAEPLIRPASTPNQPSTFERGRS